MSEKEKTEFTETNVKREFEELTEKTVKTIKLYTDFTDSVECYQIETEDGEEYIVFKDEDDATESAEARVKEDLENEPELFNQDWLRGEMNTTLDNESFIEHAAEEAVSIDGFAHFLNTYDGDYDTTESGFVVMRTN